MSSASETLYCFRYTLTKVSEDGFCGFRMKCSEGGKKKAHPSSSLFGTAEAGCVFMSYLLCTSVL